MTNHHKKFSFPCKLWSERMDCGGGNFRIASTLVGSNQIPCFEIIKPSMKLDLKKKTHLYKFKHM